MIRVRISSKGQLVIPRQVRRALALKAGDTLELEMVGDTVVLRRPDDESALAALYGCLSGVDLIAELEREHEEELSADSERSP